MSLQATPRVDVTAAVSLRVPRGESDDLESGVAEVLSAVDGVERVAVDAVTGVRPTWTDLRVEADVGLTVVVEVRENEERVGAVERVLADGFGVTDVEGLIVDASG